MSITAPKGFLAAGMHCGIKNENKLDLALVAVEGDISANSAAVFTTNKLQAAPVQISRQHLEKSKSHTKAIILNSGCANAATGQQGEKNTIDICEKTAQELNVSPQEILMCSTGLIGYQLPEQKILDAIPQLTQSLSNDGGHISAQAIMTTDTHPKEYLVEGDGFTVGGMAKGAAMLAPNMATMLAVITTDATCEKPHKNLPKILHQAVGQSFNRLSVDGVQSTNDTVILLANGQAGEKPISEILDAVTTTCKKLAEMMASDAEGSTRTVKLHVFGAHNAQQADQTARYLVNSMLIKCSWHGADPYWGRLASELGAAGVDVDLDKLTLSYGEHIVFKRGTSNEAISPKSNLAELNDYMSGEHLDVFVDLGLGNGSAYMLSCDLGHGYIEENSKTS